MRPQRESARQNIKRIHKRVQEIVSGWPSVMDSEVVAVRLTPPAEPTSHQALEPAGRRPRPGGPRAAAAHAAEDAEAR